MSTTQQATTPFSVYFDGSCPLCIREIGFYKRQRGADAIDWVDVSDNSFCMTDLSCTEAMARFHVRDQSGKLYDGGTAFARLWKELPAFKWIGTVLVLPGFRHVTDVAYNLFLPLRPRLQRLFRKRLEASD